MPGDFDLGQTSGAGAATGSGTAIVRDIADQLSIGGDLDVGQTSGLAGGVNMGTGDLTLDRISLVNVGADVDVAQSTGEGRSYGIGTLRVTDVGALTIGDSLDIGKVRAFNSALNEGVGNVTVSGADLNVGFGVVNPGSIEIARVLVSELARGRGTGSLFLENANIDVANDVIVGELALGGTNAGSLANGTLSLLDSKLDTRDLTVAARFDNTVGALSGVVELQRSLAVVQSVLALGTEATLRMHIDGTVRSLGDGDPTDYAAIDADMASLGGRLEIETGTTYAGPALRGAVDTFQLITALFGASGAFDAVFYEGVALGAGFTFVGETNAGDDGLFVDVSQTPTEVQLAAYLALPGDANGDMVVDVSDFNIWNSNKFSSGTTWITGDFNGDGNTDVSDFNIWNGNKFSSVAMAVPEPQLVAWLWASLLLIACQRVCR